MSENLEIDLVTQPNLEKVKERKGAIAWMAANPVASNMLMMFLIVGGLIFGVLAKKEIYPAYFLDVVQVQVEYPGAGPEEIEKNIVVAIEDVIRNLDGVNSVNSSILQGYVTVSAELTRGTNPDKLLQDIKNAVDQIESLPKESERPKIGIFQAKGNVISIYVHGDVDIWTLRDLTHRVKDDLQAIDGITYVTLYNIPPLEISVEVPQDELRKYQLTLDKIATRIRENSIDLPGGGVKTSKGEVLLRTTERKDRGKEFEDIPIITNKDGTRILLRDIGAVTEQFEHGERELNYNGQPGFRMFVYRVQNESPEEVSKKVKGYITQANRRLPDNVRLDYWEDRSEAYSERVSLLLKNAAQGFVLLLIVLGLFLDIRLAFWISVGIPTSIIGSFLLFPALGATINMISLFAFIITLGIIVDDAIVVGENIYHKRSMGSSPQDAAYLGTVEVSKPIVFAVLTNIVAFFPMLFIPGTTGKLFYQIPAVTIAVFTVSLVESLFVLPSHLSHKYKKSRFWDVLSIPSASFGRFLDKFINKMFHRMVMRAMKYRYVTVCIAVSMLIITLGIVSAGYVKFTYLPGVESKYVIAEVNLPFGSSMEKAREAEKYLIKTGQEVAEEFGEGSIEGIVSQIGDRFFLEAPPTTVSNAPGSHIITAQVSLNQNRSNPVGSKEFSRKWREKAQKQPGYLSISFQGEYLTTGGFPIDIELKHESLTTLVQAGKELASRLQNYKGVKDVNDGKIPGKPQFTFKIKPEAMNLGLTASDVANQVRSSFYGAEALRQQRGWYDVRVMVKLPKRERESISTLENMVVFTPDGGEIPFFEAVNYEVDRAFTEIQRADGKPVIHVTAKIDSEKVNANDLVTEIDQNVLPSILSMFPGLTYTFGGQQKAQQESLGSLKIGYLLALVAVFSLLAIPSNSYVQPILIMLSIPFGIVGAVLGHIIMGYDLSIVSVFGIIALSGVVVNDSLVLMVTINRYREKSKVLRLVLAKACKARFRPIILTSLTTFFGLMPMVLEKSPQAKFLIPMAISLGFGILFATFIILFLVPCFYFIMNDVIDKKK